MAYNILIAEEEPQLSNSIALVLIAQGYGATIVDSGAQALQHIRQSINRKPVDLLIAEVQTTVVEGVSLIPLVLHVYPQIHVVGISGYGDHTLTRIFAKQGCHSFIDKPFTDDNITKIVQAVREGKEECLS